MKLYSIFILYKEPKKKVRVLKSSLDLNSFGFFKRRSVSKFMRFTAKILVEKAQVSSRSSVKEQEYLAHVHIRNDNLSGVIISDQEYPDSFAHTLINKVLDDFTKVVAPLSWSSIAKDSAKYDQLTSFLAEYQNPKEVLLKLQADLDETKLILYQTISAVLERGEKLDDLIAKSEDLGMTSKRFYKAARKTNSLELKDFFGKPFKGFFKSSRKKKQCFS